jgi:hypothetical protein
MADEFSKLRSGAIVNDIRGRAVGIVKAVSENRFLLQVSPDSEVWLDASVLFTVTAMRATMICEASQFDAYIVAGDDASRRSP